MKKIIIVIMSCTILFMTACNRVVTPNSETSSEKDTIINEDGWGVPVYENVNRNELDFSSLKYGENGRIYSENNSIFTEAGIDVSQFQGEIDWKKVASDGIDFVILRVGFRGWGPSGLIYEDDLFDTNYLAAKEAGLKVGVYFYSQAITVEEAIEEAEFVLSKIKNYKLDYPIAFDWEHVTLDGTVQLNPDARSSSVSADDVTLFCERFCDTITNAGYKAIAYFNCADGYQLYDLDKLTDYHFWLAEYGNLNPTFIYDFQIWQYSKSGTVDGINGTVDLNLSFYDFCT